MKLYGSLTSPFVRKIRIAIQEYGLADQVEFVVTDPWQSQPEFLQKNPLAKVPALLTAQGVILPDSELIMNYLDALKGLTPGSASDVGYWERARLIQLADGVIDAAVAVVIETLKRPAEFIYSGWVERQTDAVIRSLDALELSFVRSGSSILSSGPVAGRLEVTLSAALGYVEFRFPKLAWRARCPGLATWYTVFKQRPSMQSTQPPT